MATIELTGAGHVRVLRRYLSGAGLPTDDRTVVELANRLADRVPERAAQVDRLHHLFGVPTAIREGAPTR